MKRKEIRKTLKKWLVRETTEYNCLEYTFVDVELGKTTMTPSFESLVDEVYKMIQEKNEKVIKEEV